MIYQKQFILEKKTKQLKLYKMKKAIFAVITACTIYSCGAYMRGMSGATKDNLIKTVSIEQNCPIENITIVEEVRRTGSATYALEACGKRVIYKQLGSVFMESSQADKLIESQKAGGLGFKGR